MFDLGPQFMGVMSVVSKATSSHNWDVKNLLEHGGEALNTWSKYLMIIIGIVMVVVGIYQIAKGLIGQGGQRGQTNWVVAILLIIFGGAIGFQALAGWEWVRGIAVGGVKTIEDIADGGDVSTILLPFQVGAQMLLPF